jgi:aspartate/methionine/tyrosine aminotransferase
MPANMGASGSDFNARHYPALASAGASAHDAAALRHRVRLAMLDISPAFANLGTETAFEVLARANALKAEGKDIINLGIGQPDFQTPPHVVEAAAKALRDGHHGYTPANGIPQLREAVVRDLSRRYGVTVDPGLVLVVPGGKVTMFFAIMMFGRPGVEIMYPNPGFPIYESTIRFSGATAVPIPLLEDKGFAFSADDVLSRITPRTRLIIINSPANPTGGVVPVGELEKLAAGLERHPHVAIMSDEIYGQLTYDNHRHATMLRFEALRDRLILLDGWSKTYAMTGWRLGFGVWPRELFPIAEKLAINDHSCVNAAAQWAGIAALDGPQDAVTTMQRAFAERRQIVVDGLNKLPGWRCVSPGGAFYAFPNITRTGLASKAMQTKLLEQAGIATVAGTSFGAYGEGFLRLSYAADKRDIERALERIAALKP